MSGEEVTGNFAWTWEQEKVFENAVAVVPEDSKDRWEQITAAVPGKSIEDIKQHYQLLVEDVESIESGSVPLPSYTGEDTTEGAGGVKKGSHGDSHHGGKGSRPEQERRKGIAWTEEEHKQFLLGLEKYGKGDWRSISRNYVVTRTPTQVASHAQKYFIRQNSMNKDRRRSSIHDITSVGNGDGSVPQGPINGQSSAAAATAGKPSKNCQAAAVPSAIGMHGAAIGRPVAGPQAPAVGTPVTLPGNPHIVYGVRAPPSGAMVPGAPVSLPIMTYPMPHHASAPR